MQFSTITTLFTLAAVATAAPTEVEARTGGTGGGSCSNSQPYEYCCSGVLPLLSCTLNILGNSCGGEAYCCDSQTSGTIAIGALNCLKL